MTRWRKRGVGWPIKYGPAHTADPKQFPLMGRRAYCGTWFPTGRDHLWTNADPDDRRCRECERGAQRTADAANTPDGPCDNCPDPFTAGQRWIYHARLNVYVHESCAARPVRGEDISTHTVMMGQVPGSPTTDTH
jgi:hypothetical protein